MSRAWQKLEASRLHKLMNLTDFSFCNADSSFLSWLCSPALYALSQRAEDFLSYMRRRVMEGVLTRTKELPWPTLAWGWTSGAEFFLEDSPLLVAEAPEQLSAWLLFSTCCVSFFFLFVMDWLSTEKNRKKSGRRRRGGGKMKEEGEESKRSTLT